MDCYNERDLGHFALMSSPYHNSMFIMDDLKQHLQSLHAELQSSQSLDPTTIDALRLVAEDIRLALEQSATGEPTNQNLTLSKRLGALVEEFEINHPRLTTIASQIAERLADMGI